MFRSPAITPIGKTMKVIVVREQGTKIVEATFLVNDDVVVSEEAAQKLKDAGFEHIVHHPEYVKDGKELNEQLEYLSETLLPDDPT